MTVSLATLLVQHTKAQIYETGLSIATSLGLPVSSWQAGDPTRSLFHLESEILTELENAVVAFIQSGFLDYATGPWLKLLADQVYGVTVPDASQGTGSVTLTNTGGGEYVLAAGDLTFKNSTTGKTYRSTSGGTLASGPGTTLSVDVIANEPGSDSSAAPGEVDELVTTLLGVTCTNAAAIVGVDEQSEATTRQQCRDKLSALSPSGAKGIYSFVALNSKLTGTTAITRVRVFSDSDTGEVDVYLATASGAVGSADRALVETALLRLAVPLCVTLSCLSATAVTVPVTYQLWAYKSVNLTSSELAAEVEEALEGLFSTFKIGGDVTPPATTGKLHVSLIQSTILSLYPQIYAVTVTLPAADVSLAQNQVAALGTVTATINLVVDP